ncbi:transcription elongation regulator 1-like protein [Ochotona curzoniae]|uniref:transcription elongation regulator 1-like protein n=1 Tax=Ochotona curzoniae TaxID=130825 RepID=UPI001B346232|nr:transcription elongation regulator 1-like protein [Ochotona curzoniae]
MLAGARLPRRRRPLQQQQQQLPRRRPSLLWPMNADPPPPWLWMVPGAAGLLRLGPGVVAPPLLLSSPAPAAPLLPVLPGWQAPGEPLLPLLPLPSAPDHAAAHQQPLLGAQWLFGGRGPGLGLPASPIVELLPAFPQACAAALPPAAGKSWTDKRMPPCKIFVNHSVALDSPWLHPQESLWPLGHEKPHVLANRVAVSVSSPLPTVLFAPQPVPGFCHGSLKPASSPAIAIAAAAMVSVDTEGLRGPSPAVPPYHFLTWAPITMPLRTVSFSDRSTECSQAPHAPTLRLPPAPEQKSMATSAEDKGPPSILVRGDDSAPRGNRPVASTPVPGSPWCVVWTGDDRVFFFNPTMQLSVWEKPRDLKDRGDLNRIIEDPPHKRKLEASAADSSDESGSEDGREPQNMKTKRNRTEGRGSPGPEEAEPEERGPRTQPPQILLPLEERVTHFRDMLLERGVSAFSTWEKELHKIVFDPRYLLLNSEERKQIFEQFVKTRIKEEYKERKSKLLLAREEFKKLLEESKVSPRTTFKEFAEKHGRDQRFRLVQKRKDQEHFFNQFILILKKRDKENRLRLRKMR